MSYRLNLRRIWAFCLVLVIILGGCCKEPIPDPLEPTSIEELRRQYVESLRLEGVQVIFLGETIKIVFPSDSVFYYPTSTQIRRCYRPILKLAAGYLRTFIKSTVEVSAYTDSCSNAIEQQYCTTKQAEVVADYLWHLGVDTRLQYALGFGRCCPIDWNGDMQGRYNNRRVEIFFRYRPIFKAYE